VIASWLLYAFVRALHAGLRPTVRSGMRLAMIYDEIF